MLCYFPVKEVYCSQLIQLFCYLEGLGAFLFGGMTLGYSRIYNVHGDAPPGLWRQCFSNHTNGPLLSINPCAASVEVTRASEPGSRRLMENKKRGFKATQQDVGSFSSGWLGELDKPSPVPHYRWRLGLAKVGMLQCCRPCLPPLVD